MAGITACRNARVVHRPSRKPACYGGSGMAILTRCRSRKVGSRFANRLDCGSENLTAMAGITTCRYSGMVHRRAR